MNILTIPEQDEAIALQRFLNIANYIGQEGSRYLSIGYRKYGAVPQAGCVFITYEDFKTTQRDVWELVVPNSWFESNELDDIKSVVIDEKQFVSDFHEFIENYTEGSPEN